MIYDGHSIWCFKFMMRTPIKNDLYLLVWLHVEEEYAVTQCISRDNSALRTLFWAVRCESENPGYVTIILMELHHKTRTPCQSISTAFPTLGNVEKGWVLIRHCNYAFIYAHVYNTQHVILLFIPLYSMRLVIMACSLTFCFLGFF